MKKILIILILILSLSLIFTSCTDEELPSGNPPDTADAGTPPDNGTDSEYIFAEYDAKTSFIAAAMSSAESIYPINNVAVNMHYGFKTIVKGMPIDYTGFSFKLSLTNDSGKSVFETGSLESAIECPMLIWRDRIPANFFEKSTGEIYFEVEYTNGTASAKSEKCTLYYATNSSQVALCSTKINTCDDVSQNTKLSIGDALSVSFPERLKLEASGNGTFTKDTEISLPVSFGIYLHNASEVYKAFDSIKIVASTLNGGVSEVILSEAISVMPWVTYDSETQKYTFPAASKNVILPASLFTEDSGIIKLELTANSGSSSLKSNTVYIEYTIDQNDTLTLSKKDSDFKTYKINFDFSEDNIDFALAFKDVLKSSYASGEKITITLAAMADSYLEIYANGTKATYLGNSVYEFEMPEDDVELTFNIAI